MISFFYIGSRGQVHALHVLSNINMQTFLLIKGYTVYSLMNFGPVSVYVVLPLGSYNK